MTDMIWCVRTDAAGAFKYAKPRRAEWPAESELIVWSIEQWLEADRSAAEQYLTPNDEHRRLQQEFCRVTGLDTSNELHAAILDAFT